MRSGDRSWPRESDSASQYQPLRQHSGRAEAQARGVCRRPCKARRIGFELMEEKILMHGGALTATVHTNVAVLARPALSFPSAGVSAVMNAIFGGAGHEFVELGLREVHNVATIVRGFESGTLTQFSVPGLAFKQTNLQPLYTGLPHDTLSLNAAGAVILKRKTIELAAIVRGPFTTTPRTTYIVFAINRGAGGQLGPAFASRPGITPDATVTVQVGPYGVGNSAWITDLTTGATQSINPALISVAGPTVRLLVSESQLPREGFALSKYTFAVWTETEQNAPISQVGSFIPEDSMVPIGVETNVNPPKI
jgi:hypothetical protein